MKQKKPDNNSKQIAKICFSFCGLAEQDNEQAEKEKEYDDADDWTTHKKEKAWEEGNEGPVD